jgi:hypothetical protein
MADLDLLVDYVDRLEKDLAEAQQWTRLGQLDRAVWAYLEVLEVDPDNAEARKQVGRVATAVRQFDRTAPGRRWIAQERGEAWGEDMAARAARWLRAALVVLLLLAAFAVGYSWGNRSGDDKPRPPTPPSKDLKFERPADTLGR